MRAQLLGIPITGKASFLLLQTIWGLLLLSLTSHIASYIPAAYATHLLSKQHFLQSVAIL